LKKFKKSKALYTAGKVLTISKQGRVIIKLGEHVPRLGERVYDRNLKYVGVVVDVIGNVKSPYAVVRPLSTKDLRGLVDETLYFKG